MATQLISAVIGATVNAPARRESRLHLEVVSSEYLSEGALCCPQVVVVLQIRRLAVHVVHREL